MITLFGSENSFYAYYGLSAIVAGYIFRKEIKDFLKKEKKEEAKIIVEGGEIVLEDTTKKNNTAEKNNSSLQDEFKKIADEFSELEDGTIKVPFEKAMYLMRHYDKRSVISEDGKVHFAGLKSSQIVDVDKNGKLETKLALEEQIKSDVEKTEMYTIENKNGEQKVTYEDGVIVFKDNKIISTSYAPEKTNLTKASMQNTSNNSSIDKLVEILVAQSMVTGEKDIAEEEQVTDTPKKEINLFDFDDKKTNEEPLDVVHKKEQEDTTSKQILDLSKKLDTLISSQGDMEKIKEEKRLLEEQAYKCQLTRAYNRTKFDIDIKNFFHSHDNTVIAFIDGDKFKNVNDTYGRLVGDKVLQKIVNCMFQSINKERVYIYRFGGEEFLVVFVDSDSKNVTETLEDIRTSIENSIVKTEEGRIVKFTISSGVAKRNKNDTIESLIKRADDAVYTAKETGRNKIVIHEEDSKYFNIANATQKNSPDNSTTKNLTFPTEKKYIATESENNVEILNTKATEVKKDISVFDEPVLSDVLSSSIFSTQKRDAKFEDDDVAGLFAQKNKNSFANQLKNSNRKRTKSNNPELPFEELETNEENIPSIDELIDIDSEFLTNEESFVKLFTDELFSTEQGCIVFVDKILSNPNMYVVDEKNQYLHVDSDFVNELLITFASENDNLKSIDIATRIKKDNLISELLEGINLASGMFKMINFKIMKLGKDNKVVTRQKIQEIDRLAYTINLNSINRGKLADLLKIS